MQQISVKGGCLCGAVQYEVTGEPLRFYHCHCSRCRKSTGTGHATNLMVQGAGLTYTQGEHLLRKYKVPDAEFFSRQFCGNCGSPVARHVPERQLVVIPAGGLDSPLPIAPQMRIFWDSRAAWTCDGDSLPRYAEYPPP